MLSISCSPCVRIMERLKKRLKAIVRGQSVGRLRSLMGILYSFEVSSAWEDLAVEAISEMEDGWSETIANRTYLCTLASSRTKGWRGLPFTWTQIRAHVTPPASNELEYSLYSPNKNEAWCRETDTTRRRRRSARGRREPIWILCTGPGDGCCVGK